MAKIELEGEVFGDWAFPRDRHDAYYKGVRAGLTPQQSIFLLVLARSGQTLSVRDILAAISPGSQQKLGHVIACNIKKRLALYGIEPPFENMYDPCGALGFKKKEIKVHVTSGYKWVG